MIKGYGLCGTHATGKTTVAEDVAKELGINFIATKTTDVYKKFKVSPQNVLDPQLRMAIQWDILDQATSLWKGQFEPWITDRTPLDFMAYVVNDSFVWEDEWYMEYLSYKYECMSAYRKYFSKVFLIQPDGVIWERDSSLKGRNSRVLQESMNTVFKGLLTEADENSYNVIRADASSAEKKIEVFDSILQELHCKGKE